MRICSATIRAEPAGDNQCGKDITHIKPASSVGCAARIRTNPLRLASEHGLCGRPPACRPSVVFSNSCHGSLRNASLINDTAHTATPHGKDQEECVRAAAQFNGHGLALTFEYPIVLLPFKDTQTCSHELTQSAQTASPGVSQHKSSQPVN